MQYRAVSSANIAKFALLSIATNLHKSQFQTWCQDVHYGLFVANTFLSHQVSSQNFNSIVRPHRLLHTPQLSSSPHIPHTPHMFHMLHMPGKFNLLHTLHIPHRYTSLNVYINTLIFYIRSYQSFSCVHLVHCRIMILNWSSKEDIL